MKFLRKRKEDKLYKQWVERGDLPPEAIPREETPKDVLVGRERGERGLRVLYILLGVSILILCVGVIILFTQWC